MAAVNKSCKENNARLGRYLERQLSRRTTPRLSFGKVQFLIRFSQTHSGSRTLAVYHSHSRAELDFKHTKVHFAIVWNALTKSGVGLGFLSLKNKEQGTIKTPYGEHRARGGHLQVTYMSYMTGREQHCILSPDIGEPLEYY